ncbi:MAG: diguanylate cyclase [Candidatus Omnitrophota bacterium]
MTMEPVTILIVDDRNENILALQAALESPELRILTASSGNEALGLLLEHDFAVVLLDVQMPDMDGFEVAELMRKKQKTHYIPIIFITAINKDEKYLFKGYEAGAVDYIFKPVDPFILKCKIDIFVQLYRQRKELEQSRIQIEQQNKWLTDLSIRDGLTDLHNRRYFEEILEREFALAKRTDSDLCCFMIDLDYFKDVNDTFGHNFGDYVLRMFAAMAIDNVRKTDIMARYGGEEFVLLLPHTRLDGARIVAEKLREKASLHTYEEADHFKRVTISIGISSLFSHHPNSGAELVNFADKALYLAKNKGRNQVRVYQEEELARMGELNELLPENFFYIRERLTKIIENTKESILSALETLLLRKDYTRKKKFDFRTRLKTNPRTMKVIEMMGDRLGLPRQAIISFKRTVVFHDFIEAFLEGDITLEQDYLNEQERLEKEIIRQLDIFGDERTILQFRHENYDGTGYPQGLSGNEIPISARIFSLIEGFLSMTANLDSRSILTPDEALRGFVKQAGHRYDPVLMDHLLDLIEEKKLLPVTHDHIREAKKAVAFKIREE